MNKKTYFKPAIMVVKVDCAKILAGSLSGGVNDGSNHGYQEDGYNDYIGGDGQGGWGHGDPD